MSIDRAGKKTCIHQSHDSQLALFAELISYLNECQEIVYIKK